MGALTYHEHKYSTEHPAGLKRTLEITTFDNHIEVRLHATGDERMNNGRVSAILSKREARALITDLQRATDYVFSGD